MAFGGYAYKGYRDRTDEMETKRLDVAKAFEDFKKNNPYATATELQSAINQIAGPNPYLRAAGGTRQTIDEIARRNKEARLEQERTRLEGDMKFKNDRKDELREQLYTSYLDTGNFDLAKKNVLMNLDATPTMSEYESLALPDLRAFIEDIDSNVENQFVRRYFDENTDALNQTIEDFGSYDDFVTLLPNQGIANSPAFKTMFSNKKSKFDEAKKAELYKKARDLASDSNAVNMYRAGQLDAVDAELGRYVQTNPEIRDFVHNIFQTQQRTLHSTQKVAAQTAAQEYATGQSDAIGEAMQSAINLDNYPGGVQSALREFTLGYRPANAGAISAIIAAAEELKDEDNITYEDARAKMLASLGGVLVPKATFEQGLRDNYITQSGRPKDMTTITAYTQEMFGDSINPGEVQQRVQRSADRVNKVSQDTDDYLAGKMSKFQSRFGPQAYTAHIADIDAEIARINRDAANINGAIRYGQNQMNFLATYGEDFNQQMVTNNNAIGAEQLAILEEQKLMLEKRKAQVQTQLDLANRRVSAQLTNRDISDEDILRLAEEVRRMGGNAQSLTAQGKKVNPRATGSGNNKILDTILKQSGLIQKTGRNMYGEPEGPDAAEEKRLLIQRLLKVL